MMNTFRRQTISSATYEEAVLADAGETRRVTGEGSVGDFADP